MHDETQENSLETPFERSLIPDIMTGIVKLLFFMYYICILLLHSVTYMNKTCPDE